VKCEWAGNRVNWDNPRVSNGGKHFQHLGIVSPPTILVWGGSKTLPAAKMPWVVAVVAGQGHSMIFQFAFDTQRQCQRANWNGTSLLELIIICSAQPWEFRLPNENHNQNEIRNQNQALTLCPSRWLGFQLGNWEALAVPCLRFYFHCPDVQASRSPGVQKGRWPCKCKWAIWQGQS